MTEGLRAAQNVRLADRVSIGVLASMFPITLLDEVVQVSGCADRRRRALPARLMIYYALALCLFTDRNYDQVMRLLLGGLSWRSRWIHSWDDPPSTSAISRARARLGAEPLRVLFDRVTGPIAEPGAPGRLVRGAAAGHAGRRDPGRAREPAERRVRLPGRPLPPSPGYGCSRSPKAAPTPWSTPRSGPRRWASVP